MYIFRRTSVQCGVKDVYIRENQCRVQSQGCIYSGEPVYSVESRLYMFRRTSIQCRVKDVYIQENQCIVQSQKCKLSGQPVYSEESRMHIFRITGILCRVKDVYIQENQCIVQSQGCIYSGEPVSVECSFNLESESLYSVKLYKGSKEGLNFLQNNFKDALLYTKNIGFLRQSQTWI